VLTESLTQCTLIFIFSFSFSESETALGCGKLGLILKDRTTLDTFLLYLNMTKTQIQSEIQKVLDSVPENVLQDVLDFLKELQHQPADKVRLTNNLRQILSEDKELLERLAQ
jgi:hypothetical protein